MAVETTSGNGSGSGSQLITIEDVSVLRALLGERSMNLRALERTLGIKVDQRGNELTFRGDPVAVQQGIDTLSELERIVRQGHGLFASDVDHAARIVRDGGGDKLREILGDTIHMGVKNRRVTPKSITQKVYVDAIRSHDIVFGIGPAGTGKTYLAMAMAIAALTRREVNRIVLCRPAVEAGEKLGFLPGDIAEKVNPYLRPLYDALHDMLDYDRAAKLVELGTIEVAPLAFMRGRAQPNDAKVLTPEGWRTMGSLQVGDWVTGSNGRPTMVMGVYPQGEKEVFRVTASDGASTVCCGEHLWSVYTASDRRRHKGPRVLQTKDMIGRLRVFHQHRFELPMLSEPVMFPEQEVPIEPYALGLLLGDGCITGSTTPAFSTRDVELVASLGAGLGSNIAVEPRGMDYVLRHVHEGPARGGLRIANPVTAALRTLELCGTRSSTKFVPDVYLYNSADVRFALLQGLLDTDGGPVTQEGRSCRVQYTSTSSRLRDDVIFLVRSLGGVAYTRTRAFETLKPGWANGREVPARHDAHVVDIRLPVDRIPFRLARKVETYERHGAGRPMRYISSIEPAGVAETRCIRVAAPDSLYVTDDFLLTHNTLNDCFVILDEAQNTTTEQMKMFLTRLGIGSKAVITGDVTQIDLPTGKASGLVDARRILGGLEDIKFCTFSDRDVVRHRLVQEIVRAYDRASAANTVPASPSASSTPNRNPA